jgi:DNA-binding transcriptional LysR family regulator
MIINQLNLNHIRIFECVYRTKSMTLAAQELHLTQSGVSQHIRAFEDVLGIRLFDRINQRVVPTSSAIMLFERCKKSLMGLEDAFAELQAEKNELAGTVRIGMPTEFGNNIVLPLIAKLAQKHPRLKFQFRLGYGSEMNQLLLGGEVDFAFIDEVATDKKIRTRAVYDETLELCSVNQSPPASLTSKNDRKYYESIDYVDFSKDQEILKRWFDHHLGYVDLRLNIKSTIEDTQGIARLVVSGVGTGILPGHLVKKLQQEGTRLHVFKGKGSPLKNTISVAYLQDRSQSRSGQAVLEHLLASLDDLKKR